ncbi:MAG: hypothetical protein MUC85_07335 [Anaerolineales bacterium]|nr:hypothetical protein [Anaerolineales bacterium]
MVLEGGIRQLFLPWAGAAHSHVEAQGGHGGCSPPTNGAGINRMGGLQPDPENHPFCGKIDL